MNSERALWIKDMPVQPTFDDRDETYVVSLTNEGGAEKMKVRKYEWDF